jgi:hypothetical protein
LRFSRKIGRLFGRHSSRFHALDGASRRAHGHDRPSFRSTGAPRVPLSSKARRPPNGGACVANSFEHEASRQVMPQRTSSWRAFEAPCGFTARFISCSRCGSPLLKRGALRPRHHRCLRRRPPDRPWSHATPHGSPLPRFQSIRRRPRHGHRGDRRRSDRSAPAGPGRASDARIRVSSQERARTRAISAGRASLLRSSAPPR